MGSSGVSESGVWVRVWVEAGVWVRVWAQNLESGSEFGPRVWSLGQSLGLSLGSKSGVSKSGVWVGVWGQSLEFEGDWSLESSPCLGSPRPNPVMGLDPSPSLGPEFGVCSELKARV